MNSKECLENLTYCVNGMEKQEKYYKIIKQDLDRLEKLEKVIEILKNKQVNIDMLTLSFEIDIGREAYNACMEVPYKLLTQEQYNLLKEVIGNEV